MEQVDNQIVQTWQRFNASSYRYLLVLEAVSVLDGYQNMLMGTLASHRECKTSHRHYARARFDYLGPNSGRLEKTTASNNEESRKANREE